MLGAFEGSNMIAQEVTVRIADTNWESIKLARMDNIPTYYGNPMSEHAGRTVDLSLYSTVLVISLTSPSWFHYHYDEYEYLPRQLKMCL
jgi:hypothetical protein